jgi:hypothetical protein
MKLLENITINNTQKEYLIYVITIYERFFSSTMFRYFEKR